MQGERKVLVLHSSILSLYLLRRSNLDQTMITIILLASVVLMLLYFFLEYAFCRPTNFPPGPPRLPLIGSYFLLLLLDYKYLHKAALILSKWYNSKTIGFYFGSFPTIVANDQAGVMEILKRPEFDGRSDVFAARLRHPDFERKGIFFVDGNHWRDHRRFMLRYLRDYGFGRRLTTLEENLTEEVRNLVEAIRYGAKYHHEKEYFRTGGGQALFPYVLCACMANSFLQVFCGQRLPRESHQVLFEMGKAALEFQRKADDYGLLLSIVPWIRYLFPKLSHYEPLRKSALQLHEFIKKIIDENIQTYQEGVERNFIDVYIKYNKANREDFDYDDFVMSCWDFFFPPISAVPAQLSFLVQHFLLRPDIFKRVQKEIDEVVGSGRFPTLDDRKNLHYTEAALREIMRLETGVPSDIPHYALQDTTFQGYNVPKGTIMIPGLYAFHNDKNLWENPDFFKPERFLDENGKLSLQKDITVPFGAGKRLCAGETFARNMMFLITSALCQHFDIVLEPGQSKPDLSKNLSGITVSTYDFWVSFKPR